MSSSKKKRLTDRQREIFEFIEMYIVETQMPPVLREIGAYFGFSEKAAVDHVNALVKKGYVQYEQGKPRTLRLTDYAKMFSVTAAVSLPHLGIAKGDCLTVSPAARVVVGDNVLTAKGTLTPYRKGQEIVGKVVGVTRLL